jgi:glycosyltransferase involved in cell wall biosynthesis
MTKVILLGATVDHSLLYIGGLPQRLVENGWTVHIVCSPGPRLDEWEGLPGISIHRLAMHRRPAPLADIGAVISWIRLLSRLRPDVVSVGTPKASLLGLAAAAVTRVPSRIYVLHGLRLESAHGLARRVLFHVERVTHRLATQTFAVSAGLVSTAVALRLVPPQKISLVGQGTANGVDSDRYQISDRAGAPAQQIRQQWGIGDTVPVIGFVGRMNRDKGLDDLRQARDILRQRCVPHHLLLVGEPDDRAGEEVLARLGAEGTNVSVTGFVTDTAPFYAVMDVLCLPSYREGFPTVVLEAAACAVPAVTTDVTGARDSVVDGVTGIIVPSHAPLRLADALERLLTDVSLRERFGRAGRERVEQNFTISVVQNAYVEAYTAAHNRAHVAAHNATATGQVAARRGATDGERVP